MEIYDVINAKEKLEQGYRCIVETTDYIIEDWFYDSDFNGNLYLNKGAEGKVISANSLKHPTMDGTTYEILVE